LDVENLIDYLLVNYYVGNVDWDHHNWYATKSRVDPAGRWRFHSWDAEHVLKGANDNVTGKNDSNGPTGIHQRLMASDEYRMLFADHVYKHFFNNGLLTPARAAEMYQHVLDQVDRAVVGESARWGDNAYEDAPYTRDAQWVAERDRLLNNYFPGRTATVLNQLKSRGWYPSVDAPAFAVNGTEQYGGEVHRGDLLSINDANSAGTVYYTLDGSDPRLPGGSLDSDAIAYTEPITVSGNLHVKARVLADGQWSALADARFYIDVSDSLRVTEMMYNPPAPTQEEIAAGFADNDDFEYIELQNTGQEPIGLDGVAFVDGIDFRFADNTTLNAGQYAVIVRNPAAFAERYPTFTGTVAGTYSGSLSNAGEHVELQSPLGGTILAFSYRDDWYDLTDGEGYSLTVADPHQDTALWDGKSGWKASRVPGGTPGLGDDGLAPGSVVINEVLAHTDEAPNDMIELYNSTAEDIDVGRWFLSDDAADLTKYQIAEGTIIPAGGYLVLTQDDNFGAGSGDAGSREGFALSEFGDDVYLCNYMVADVGGTATDVPGSYREHVDFGASPNGTSFGLYTKAAGGTDFTLMASPTFGWDEAHHRYDGAANSGSYLPPLVLNEVMYHPLDPPAGSGHDQDDYEFLELYNRSNQSWDLSEFYISGGVGFTFGWYDADSFGNESWTLEPGATAEWTASGLAGPASYDVYARWDQLDALGHARGLDGRARYEITHAGGSDVVTVDQDDPALPDADGWVLLGTYTFDAAATVTLTRGSDDPDKWTIADQVKFVGPTETVIVDDPVLTSFSTGPAGSGISRIDPGQYAVIVGDYDAFDERYDIAENGIPVIGEFTGSLSNSGEKVKLMRRGVPDAIGFVPYFRVDYVNYKDSPPWPVQADGAGASLGRIDASAYGNDAGNWRAGPLNGTPGGMNDDIIPPVAHIEAVSPDPRTTAVDELQIVFSEPVTGLDISDLSLNRDGGENLLTGGETLTTTDNVTWTLGGLTGLTAPRGAGFVAYNDHVAGARTHAYTTLYSAMDGQVHSGLLRDIETGQYTGVTLTVTQNGIYFAGTQGYPAPGTDAYNVFNGYVDLSSGTGASMEIAGPDTHTYTFSGLDTGDAATYTFTGTAVRGRSSYTDRWTKVTLQGAESATPAHSTGDGVIILSDTQVAIWTGYNAGANQGYV
ncbi:MAG: lamin tail domain-containing protein, partial [Planctomycetes bacterium]|nr:lamin tail domain-containing protein [Planctomycetota bacterium]